MNLYAPIYGLSAKAVCENAIGIISAAIVVKTIMTLTLTIPCRLILPIICSVMPINPPLLQ